ncbi:carboxylic ester hydrolase [Elysia marginata]|uniref:Carboxylic ester hydrolase n=1 Tax=Elysia marginata TaxID=1093978 RepID=A0AAV4GKM7_9GAST|nr:carboxylic ester hydrolase [Elysia marginata]
MIRIARLLLLLGSLVLLAVAQGPQLQTTNSIVTGAEHDVNGKKVEVFYGVPYAKPPIGMYRFGLAGMPSTKPSHQIDGTVKPPACWQLNSTDLDGLREPIPVTEMSEDCLYLNIWRPKTTPGIKKKIMVWIHGGGFMTGSAVLDAYEGSELAAREDVILITIAYRLAALGFMYVDGLMQGNFGLFDQFIALTWINMNAGNIGGTKGDITIFGQGAGAASVGFHLLFQTSKSLFSTAIMQSGSPFAPWATMGKTKATARTTQMVESLGCKGPFDVMKLYNCLRPLSAQELNDALAQIKHDRFELPIAPIIDRFLFRNDPRDTLKNGAAKLTSVIIGVNKNEGILAGVSGFKEELALEKKGKLSKKKEFRTMILSIAHNDTTLQTKLMKQYHREHVMKNRRLEIVDASIGDLLYKCPMLDFAREYTKQGGKVYMYSFEERFKSNPSPEWMGVPHGSEVEVAFGATMKDNSASSSDDKASTQMLMALWTSLAKTGKPSFLGIGWPLFTLQDEEYLEIGGGGMSTENHLRQKTCALWHAFEESNP